MKRSILFAIAMISFIMIKAQLKTPDFQSLKLNSSPAFVILGVEPENIQRPTSPTQFIGGFQNSMINQKLKPNLAFEITPYYLTNPAGTNSKRLSETHFVLNPEKGLFNTAKRTLSISFATSESDTVTFGKLKPGLGIGTGIRFQLVGGRPSENIKKWNRRYIENVFYQSVSGPVNALPKTAVMDMNIILEKVLSDFKNISVKNLDYNGFSAKEINEMLVSFKQDIIYEITFKNLKTRNEIVKYLQEKEENMGDEEDVFLKTIINAKNNPLAKMGFMLEFSSGGVIVLQNNQWSDAKNGKAAFWLTPSYRFDISKNGSKTFSLLDLMAVFRYTVNNKKDSIDLANYVDVGVKGQFIRSMWSGSVEWVYRKASEKPAFVAKDYTYRLVSSLDYKLNEMLTFKFAFGANFDGNTATYSKPKEMFAVGGLNLGLFNPSK